MCEKGKEKRTMINGRRPRAVAAAPFSSALISIVNWRQRSLVRCWAQWLPKEQQRKVNYIEIFTLMAHSINRSHICPRGFHYSTEKGLTKSPKTLTATFSHTQQTAIMDSISIIFTSEISVLPKNRHKTAKITPLARAK